MTWETFDDDWDEQAGADHPDLPFDAAYTRDDGYRLEFYRHEHVDVIECSEGTDVVAKAGYVTDGDRPLLVPLRGPAEWVAFWQHHPTIATAALRYAERTWPPRKAEA